MINENETIIDIGGLGMTLTDEQVHTIYTDLAEVDKASADNLNAAMEETENSNYTSEDNNEIDIDEMIPGVNVTPESIIENIHETEKDIKDALDPYNFDDETAVALIKVIDEYRSGKHTSLYSRLPKTIQDMVDNLLMAETNGKINFKDIMPNRNRIAKMLLDSFINDAKMSAAIEEYDSEMTATINQMNEEYDTIVSDAIDNVFNKIDEIRESNPDQANRIESVKKAFDEATTFERQLNFAINTTAKKFDKYLTRFKDNVYYFNKRVNNNTFGVKVNNVEELIPIIKLGLPQYSEDDIKKFIICICNTLKNVDDINEIAYQYRMIGSIYKYKFTSIDEKGETIFSNISKVIESILS